LSFGLSKNKKKT